MTCLTCIIQGARAAETTPPSLPRWLCGSASYAGYAAQPQCRSTLRCPPCSKARKASTARVREAVQGG